nr:retrovirus-related Pol polyprotein from transposon TNT 1-94 [Tanacetum cinerariifolium]
MLLMQAQENGVALDAEQLLFLASGQDNVFDDDVDEQPVQDLALNVDNVFQADDCDTFDSDVDEAPTAYPTMNTTWMLLVHITKDIDNEVSVVHSGASSVPTDAFMMIYNDMCESHCNTPEIWHYRNVEWDWVSLDVLIVKEADVI